MTAGEGTHIKKIVSRYHSKNWVIFDDPFPRCSAYKNYADMKILIDNQPTDDLSLECALK
jgi:hypothetical protein